MRKHRLLLAALVLAGILSCSKLSSVDEVTVPVHFTVSLEAATKAISDGTSANQLIVGVLDAEGNPLDDYRKVVTRSPGQAFSFELKLVGQMEYTVLLFAQSAERFISSTAYSGDSGTAAQLFSVPLPSAMTLNTELDDAFTGSSTFTASSTSIGIVLTHAWGQVNIASAGDIEDISAVTLTIPGLPSHYDVRTSETSSGSVMQTLTVTGNPLSGKIFNDGSTDYHYIGYAYVPIGKTLFYTSPTLVLTRSGTPSEITLGSIPLQANYRTNILGDL